MSSNEIRIDPYYLGFIDDYADVLRQRLEIMKYDPKVLGSKFGIHQMTNEEWVEHKKQMKGQCWCCSIGEDDKDLTIECIDKTDYHKVYRIAYTYETSNEFYTNDRFAINIEYTVTICRIVVDGKRDFEVTVDKQMTYTIFSHKKEPEYGHKLISVPKKIYEFDASKEEDQKHFPASMDKVCNILIDYVKRPPSYS